MSQVVDLARQGFDEGALVAKARLRPHQTSLDLRMLARKGQQRLDQNSEILPEAAELPKPLDHVDDAIAHQLVLLADPPSTSSLGDSEESSPSLENCDS